MITLCVFTKFLQRDLPGTRYNVEKKFHSVLSSNSRNKRLAHV